jgi:hypothetical protein
LAISTGGDIAERIQPELEILRYVVLLFLATIPERSDVRYVVTG